MLEPGTEYQVTLTGGTTAIRSLSRDAVGEHLVHLHHSSADPPLRTGRPEGHACDGRTSDAITDRSMTGYDGNVKITKVTDGTVDPVRAGVLHGDQPVADQPLRRCGHDAGAGY